jgi:aspartyl protease family protein
MPTGFMRRHCICLLLALAPFTARAADVALIGVIGDKAAVFAVDGGEPKTVKVGQTWSGVSVVSVERNQATVEINGARRVLALGQHYRGAAPAAGGRTMATLAADSRGHFFTDASINDAQIRVVVDTGASVVVIPAADAARLRIDWKSGEKRTLQTANGPTTGYMVRLPKVKVGGIELHDIDGIVLEQGLSVGLLGMSFLNRVEMKRDGDVMTLIRRF